MLILDDVEWWTFDLVRQALAEAMDYWRRTPGDGRSPFASDGPWHLMLREVSAGDYDARGGDLRSSDVPLRPLPLSQAQVGQRDRVSEWLRFIEQPEDRRLVALACTYYARGYQQVPWRKIKHRMRIPRGEFGLRKRFERAIGAIAKGLNAEIDAEGATKIGPNGASTQGVVPCQ